jgi:excisionase family DNA binding protein
MRPQHRTPGAPVNLQAFMPASTRTHELLDRPLLSPADVAKLLGIKRSTVYELARVGRIPSLRIGRAVRFLRADLEAWIQDQRSDRPHRT